MYNVRQLPLIEGDGELKKRILTGDRPTGKLHLGHYCGSLQHRVRLQDEYDQFVMLADVQALTDNFKTPEVVRQNILEVALDYLAVGIDFSKSTVFIQSMIPELFELTVYFLNLVSMGRLQQNPTVKTELESKSFKHGIPAGFMCYPVSQAADITLFLGELVPVGEDQHPMIEQTNELVKRFNTIYKTDVLKKAKALTDENDFGRIQGIDGKGKMSKSMNNFISLSEDTDTLRKKVRKMFTDPGHLNIEDPGKVEGNMVFYFLDLFGKDKATIEAMKEHYKRGGLADSVCKEYLFEVLEEMIAPFRERRALYAQDPAAILLLLDQGTKRAQEVAKETMYKIRRAMKINYNEPLVQAIAKP
ncbi:MAG: Tryptophan--tRNA ligase 2 [Chlamydiia bacterium]|nr:Tryptophan--tRNA ligase 2 [Chlamydiia bacterium]